MVWTFQGGMTTNLRRGWQYSKSWVTLGQKPKACCFSSQMTLLFTTVIWRTLGYEPSGSHLCPCGYGYHCLWEVFTSVLCSLIKPNPGELTLWMRSVWVSLRPPLWRISCVCEGFVVKPTVWTRTWMIFAVTWLFYIISRPFEFDSSERRADRMKRCLIIAS